MYYLSHELQPSDMIKLIIQKHSETPCYWISYSFSDLVAVLSEISDQIFYKNTYSGYYTDVLSGQAQRFTINYYDEVVLSEDLKLYLTSTFWKKNFPSFTYDFQPAKIEAPDLLQGL